MRKRWLTILISIAALALAAISIAPLFIHADTFRPTLESDLSAALNRKVALGHLSLSLWTGSLVADDLSIADDPRFSSAPLLQAKSLYIGIRLGEFLFHHRIDVTDLAVHRPVIHLIHARDGRWNFSTLAAVPSAPSSTDSKARSPITINKLQVIDGNVTVVSPTLAKPVLFSNVQLTLLNLSPASPTPFQLSADLPGDGTMSLNGAAGPISARDVADTPLHGSLLLKHLDPVAAGLLSAGQGVEMLANIRAQVVSDGDTLAIKGKLQAAHLKLARSGTPAAQPVDIDYAVSENLRTRAGQVSTLNLHAGSAAVRVAGTFQFAPETIDLNLHLSAPSVPIDQLDTLLPAAGVRLPSGSALRGGTLTASLAITGPATAVHLSGPVQVDNTRLTGFDLGSRVRGLHLLSRTVGGTDIQTFRADVDSTPQGTQLTNIYGSFPQVGTATGEGTVSSSGALDFHLIGKLSGSSRLGAVADDAANALGGIVGGILHGAVTSGIPLTITGTASDPSIQANLGQILTGRRSSTTPAQQRTGAGLLKSLFGK